MSVVKAVCEIAAQAGAAIMAIYADGDAWDVQKKSDASPLTAADLAAHHLIQDALTALTPDIPVISEESVSADIEARHQWARCWVVDPLDGTKEFLKRNGEFTVNIALVENHKSVMGVVYVPVTGVTYYAVAGEGSFKIENGVTTRMHCRKLDGSPVTVVGSRSHRSANEDNLLAAVEREFGQYTMVNYGSSLKTCLVAEGVADCYPRFGPTMEWDTAAAQIVLEEAGGQLLSFRGKAFQYNLRDTLTNRGFVVVGDQAERWLGCWPEGES
jgi:3'(2'), 5'-bisphosphate nucleotidase